MDSSSWARSKYTASVDQNTLHSSYLCYASQTIAVAAQDPRALGVEDTAMP